MGHAAAVATATLTALVLAAAPAAAAGVGQGASVEEFFPCFYSGPQTEFGFGDGRVIQTPSGHVQVVCTPPHP